MSAPFVRSPYNYDRDAASDESGLDCSVDRDTGEYLPSMTKQSFAEECDINTIVRRFGLTGELPEGVRAPTFGDFQDVPDYHSAMNAIRQADEAFFEMPAELRARFGNDAGLFVEFCSDEKNRDEAERMGLVLKKASEETMPLGATESPVAKPKAPVEPPGGYPRREE